MLRIRIYRDEFQERKVRVLFGMVIPAVRYNIVPKDEIFSAIRARGKLLLSILYIRLDNVE